MSTNHISSHWQSMLRGFDGNPMNLRGVSSLHHPAMSLLHALFQTRYRAMGAKLHNFPLYLDAGRRVAKKQGRAFDLNMLRQALTLAFCDQHGALKDASRFVVIGDGYGSLGSTIAEAFPTAQLTFVNIEPVLTVDLKYFRAAHPRRSATFMRSEDMTRMPENDVSFDIACMGEINPSVRNTYCMVRGARSRYIYSCNRTEKTFPDGTVTRFADYPWQVGYAVRDGLCPWHQDYYSFRPPFVRKFDGPMEHVLIKN